MDAVGDEAMVFFCEFANAGDAHQEEMESSCNGAAVETDRLETGDVAEDGEDESDKGDVVALFEEMQGLGKEHITHDIECGACEEEKKIYCQ